MVEYWDMRRISVIEPISNAIERVKDVLFRPFDMGKWFTIGFCAWLATLGESGGGRGGGGGGNGSRGGGSAGQEISREISKVSNFVIEHLVPVIIVGLTIAVIIAVVTVLILWLKSRGQFMFLHCVARNAAEVKVPWNKYRVQANSLCLFLIVLVVVGAAFIIPMLISFIIILIPIINAGSILQPTGIMTCIGMGLIFTVVMITFQLIGKFAKDFVVPIMYLRGNTCMEAWKEFWPLLMVNKGKFVLYMLFQFVLNIVIFSLIVLAALITCCVACCIMGIPYLGTVLLLPIFTFKRAYSLYYLAQYGPEYNVFSHTADDFDGLQGV